MPDTRTSDADPNGCIPYVKLFAKAKSAKFSAIFSITNRKSKFSIEAADPRILAQGSPVFALAALAAALPACKRLCFLESWLLDVQVQTRLLLGLADASESVEPLMLWLLPSFPLPAVRLQ